MAYLGLFTIICASCIMGSLASTELSTSEIEDEGRLFFGTSSAATGTGDGSTSATITGWETTLIVGVAFIVVFIVWIFLIFGLPAVEAPIAYAPTAYDPFAAHSAPTGFASGHHAPAAHHAPTAHHDPHGLHSSYSVLRSLDLAEQQYR